jgi:TetR/AcrR family transcriptional regulator, transcriptional repressor of aconitase
LRGEECPEPATWTKELTVPRVSEAHLAARRRQILDAAHAVFPERGFARASMDDVARAANLSIGAVYRYFPGKSDLILAVCSGHGDDPDDDGTQESAAALLARLAGYVLPGGGHAKFAVQVWAEAALSPGLAASVAATHGHLQSRLARLIAQRADGSDQLVASTETHAQVALAALIGLAALVAAGVPVDEDGFLAELTEFTDG